MNMYGFLFFIGSILIGCAGLLTQSKHLTLVELEKLEIGKATQSETLKVLGQPNKKIQKEDGTIFIFLSSESGYQRAGMTFDSNGILVGKLWLVATGENEEHFEFIKEHYNSAVFELQETKWTSHYEPTERYFVDKKNGIQISVDKNKNLVDSIGWSAPSNRVQLEVHSSQMQ